MANIREIIVDWTAAGNGGGSSIMHTLDNNPASASRLALYNFLTSCAGLFATTTSWSIRQEGRVLDVATGALVGEWSDATARIGAGTGGASPVANATQVLVRWRTDTIVNGRFLRGRTYLPGMVNTLLSGGQLSSSGQSIVNAAAATYCASADSPVVWHRPTGGAGGSHDTAISGVAWQELATLRRRRQ